MFKRKNKKIFYTILYINTTNLLFLWLNSVFCIHGARQKERRAQLKEKGNKNNPFPKWELNPQPSCLQIEHMNQLLLL